MHALDTGDGPGAYEALKPGLAHGGGSFPLRYMWVRGGASFARVDEDDGHVEHDKDNDEDN